MTQDVTQDVTPLPLLPAFRTKELRAHYFELAKGKQIAAAIARIKVAGLLAHELPKAVA